VRIWPYQGHFTAHFFILRQINRASVCTTWHQNMVTRKLHMAAHVLIHEFASIKDSCVSCDIFNIVMSEQKHYILGDNDASKIRTRIWHFLCKTTRPFRKKKIDSFDVLHSISGSTQSLPITGSERIANFASMRTDPDHSGRGPFLQHSLGTVSTHGNNESKFIHSRRNARSRYHSVP